jgi:two-component system, NtrC family, sensor kinase
VKERAEPDSSAHARTVSALVIASPVCSALAPVVTELHWLSPCAASLAALGRSPTADTWHVLRSDPGAVLLLLRLPSPSFSPTKPASLASRLHDPALLDAALQYLAQSPRCFVDWKETNVQAIYRAALCYARLNYRLAECLDLCDPEEAWVCGLLAPLGWLLAAAADPAAAAGCLADPDMTRSGLHTQQLHWGLDAAAIGRRLARRWQLPDWITAVVGYLRLPLAVAQTFGADRFLFPLTKLAVGLAREKGVDLGLVDAAAVQEAATTLGVSVVQCSELVSADEPTRDTAALAAWESPDREQLLPDLLRIAADNRRLHAVPLQQRLDEDLDDLHALLQEQLHGEADRLQACKLAALAEFAAGAGHEINNPLAVISGQAQYLIGHQNTWFTGEGGAAASTALHKIIAQTKRIHTILRDLMQFARPATPNCQWFDLPTLLGEVTASLRDMAAEKKVRLEVGTTPAQFRAYADADQVRVALTCLLQNAIEAAPADGWARVAMLEPIAPTEIQVAVEDSGTGPDPAMRAHLFDPFYSGRSAGRGQGLGLPIAWRLIRQQGGDVRLARQQPHEPTRFVIHLPRATGAVEAVA